MDNQDQSQYAPPSLDQTLALNESVVLGKSAANESVPAPSASPSESTLSIPHVESFRVASNASSASNQTTPSSMSTVPEYVSLHEKGDIQRITPFHRGKLKSHYSLASELGQFTRFPSNETVTKYADIASLVSTYTSFVPRVETPGLLQIEYTVKQRQCRLSSICSLSTFCLFLYAISYILLFIESTSTVARPMVLCMALALSLLFTMKPSFLPIPIPVQCQWTIDGDERSKDAMKMNARIIRFPVDQSTVPLLSVLSLCLCGDSHFSWHSAWRSMKGDDIKPWSVLALLFGLCYLCVTLDATGILKGFALKTADAAGSNQKRLFFFIFLFTAILTVCTNNDIAIICLSPLVISTANSGNIDAAPFIFMVLFAANTFSMLLVTGNPANLIVEEAAGLSYISYLKYMAAPTLITGVALYVALTIMFRKELSMKWTKSASNVEWMDLVILPKYAILCALRLFMACIGIPIVGQIQENNPSLKQYPLDMFVVTVIAAFSVILDLIVFDIPSLAQHSDAVWNDSDLNQSLIDIDTESNINKTQLFGLGTRSNVELSAAGMYSTMNTNDTVPSNALSQIQKENTRIIHDTFSTFDSNALLFEKRRHKIHLFALDAIYDLPWKLIPFVFGLFVIVGFMDNIGFVDFLADSLVKNVNDDWTAMLVIGFSAAILCQFVNNQPMTVLLSTVLSRIQEKEEDVPEWINGAYFALAIGANLGGNGTPIASLAVLMWKGILEKWQIQIKYISFSMKGLPITMMLTALCVTLTAIEVVYIF